MITFEPMHKDLCPAKLNMTYRYFTQSTHDVIHEKKYLLTSLNQEEPEGETHAQTND